MLCYNVDNLVLDTLSDPVANHDSHVDAVSEHTSPRAHRIIYLNSTQPSKYRDNKIRL